MELGWIRWNRIEFVELVELPQIDYLDELDQNTYSPSPFFLIGKINHFHRRIFRESNQLNI